MIDTLKQLLRGALFFVLAIISMTMAFIFMISSAFAIGILYVVARVKGRPFGVKAYWAQRRKAPMQKNPFKNNDVMDIEMRELH